MMDSALLISTPEGASPDLAGTLVANNAVNVAAYAHGLYHMGHRFEKEGDYYTL
ncbi:hypothetical protein GCM10017044_21490 [Kordiimonas sediminis]|uniref:Uncharacterized protein n=1 Tax=Kordiimonas sediminis TaxID=1735581 RepID=A0A919AWA9_9PROT|nr:hypothetical protein GCM10017044_21490 [Kordiimonas sediminis]